MSWLFLYLIFFSFRLVIPRAVVAMKWFTDSITAITSFANLILFSPFLLLYLSLSSSVRVYIHKYSVTAFTDTVWRCIPPGFCAREMCSRARFRLPASSSVCDLEEM